AYDPGTGELILGDNPSYYEFMHELFHAIDHRNRGISAAEFRQLPTLEKEEYVFTQLLQEHIWNQLTRDEQLNAIDVLRASIYKDDRYVPTPDDTRRILGLITDAERRLKPR